MANTLKFGNGEWYGKKDTILAYNDENSNYKPLPFDFSRASSATRVNKAGLIETVGSGEPRIDYKDNTKGTLLLEPSRSNLFPYSQYFGVGGLEVTTIGTQTHTITNNYSVSPDGTQNALRFQATVGGSSSDRVILRDALTTTAVDSTLSLYAKSNTTSNFTLVFHYNGGTRDAFIVTPEWKRFTYSDLSNTINNVGIELKGDETSLEADVSLYGFQFENNSYATSYIPTSGSAVTRIADSSSQTVPSGIYGTNEVTFVIDFEINGDAPSFSNIFNTNKNTASSFGITREDSSGFLKPFLFEGGVDVGNMTSTSRFLNGVRGKFAVGFKSGDSALAVKGIVEDTNSATFSNFNVNEIHLNDLFTYFGYNTNLRIYDFKLYNTRLTDNELQKLTQV